MNVCNLVWNYTQRKSRKEVESNQIDNFCEDKVFLCHVGNHVNEL